MGKMKKKSTIFIALSVIFYVVLFALIKVGFINDYYRVIIISILINIILAVSLNLTMGFLGQLALGHAGFMAIGAYTSTLFILHYNTLPHWLAFAIGIILAGLLAAFFGFVIGVPTLRLNGDYLAIVTLAFNVIIRNILESMKITHGAQGIYGIPNYTSFTVAYAIMMACLAITILLIKSRHGRAIISIREDEIASEASGINTVYYKLLAFCITAFFGGVAGALYAFNVGVIQPSDFTYNKSIEIAIMVVFGGLGHIGGSVVSAIILTSLPQMLIFLQKWRMLIYSALLIIFMVLKQTGKLEDMKRAILNFVNKFKPKKSKEDL